MKARRSLAPPAREFTATIQLHMKPLLLLATRNAHKAQEVQQILGLRVLTVADLPGAPSTVEDQDSFAGNAVKKALDLARWLGRAELPLRPSMPDGAAAPPYRGEIEFILADDSGLEVDALGGAPGVHSARFAYLGSNRAGNAPDAENNAKLLRLLEGVPLEKRTARFRCVIALAAKGSQTEWTIETFEGTCEGRMGFEAKGAAGFGYDPLFLPEGLQQTFAEIGDPVKNRISHRAEALQSLRARLNR